ncbi:MAG: hypothetical protein ABI968_13125 [Acidobacteriota bacterium]
MSNRLVCAAVLLACGFALRAEQVFYQIDLAPSGKVISQDAPTAKGATIVFHRYPDGLLMSMRRSDVRAFARITPQAAVATLPKERLVQIGTLAMQGGTSQQAGLTNASALTTKAPPAVGTGFYGNVVPGSTQGMPNSANDNVIGKSWAAPPSNAVQSSPGAPPGNPAATTGSNPPQ